MVTKKGPIIIIDDDQDDQEILQQIIQDLHVKNQVICFSTCTEALEYLEYPDTEQPFVIISDVNLPKINGVELKKKIDENERLRKKSIPFIFLSTASDKKMLEEVYEYRVQGYFIKGSSMNDLREMLTVIFKYWSLSKHPNS